MFNKLKLWFKNRKKKREERSREYWSSHDIDFELKKSNLYLNDTKNQFFTCLGACIFILTIFLVLLICTIGAFISVITPEKDNVAHADYIDDIQNNPNALVNFNQLVANDKINFTASGGSVTLCNNTNLLLAQNILYVSVDISNIGSDTTLAITGPGVAVGTHSISNGHNEFIWTLPNRNGYNNLYIYESGSTEFKNFKIINLTLMFGSENDNLTLVQCNSLFVADYYYYNAGSPVSFNSLDSYVNGYNSAFQSYSVTQTNYDVSASIFSYNTHYLNFGNSGSVSFNGIIGFKVGFTLQPGNVLNFDIRSAIAYGSNPIQIGYIVNDTFIPLISDIFPYRYERDSVTYGFRFTITMPVSTDTLYFKCFDNTNQNTAAAILGAYSIVYNIYDYQQAISTSYSSALKNIQGQYAPGTSKYNAIYNQGYNDALENGNPYTFSALMSSVIESPLNAVLNLFNFEFLGVNLKNVVTVLFTLAVLIAILSLFLGGK